MDFTANCDIIMLVHLLFYSQEMCLKAHKLNIIYVVSLHRLPSQTQCEILKISQVCYCMYLPFLD